MDLVLELLQSGRSLRIESQPLLELAPERRIDHVADRLESEDRIRECGASEILIRRDGFHDEARVALEVPD
ncbi:MAG: hypothetical protein ACXV8L_00980 [Ilumatobacteraceae bacterium]